MSTKAMRCLLVGFFIVLYVLHDSSGNEEVASSLTSPEVMELPEELGKERSQFEDEIQPYFSQYQDLEKTFKKEGSDDATFFLYQHSHDLTGGSAIPRCAFMKYAGENNFKMGTSNGWASMHLSLKSSHDYVTKNIMQVSYKKNGNRRRGKENMKFNYTALFTDGVTCIILRAQHLGGSCELWMRDNAVRKLEPCCEYIYDKWCDGKAEVINKCQARGTEWLQDIMAIPWLVTAKLSRPPSANSLPISSSS
ncbi:uncharacterized protein LOC135366275 [Ornithodoros turicata]|uniref:uncharacterized protein LOC135366275 n=1 Tax=Ornithodoros turicata TaxID=34597 RepID=UPI00313862A3